MSVEDCTGISAVWCHHHGECCCEQELIVEPGVGQVWGWRGFSDPKCPLHAPTSLHGELPSCYVCGALWLSVAERDEHEARCE